MKVKNDLKIYEIDGKELPSYELKTLSVESHWFKKDLVMIQIGDLKVAVIASELFKAVQNSTNK